jgi:hypothetical protein
VYGGDRSRAARRATLLERRVDDSTLDVCVDARRDGREEGITSGERGGQIVGEAQPRTVDAGTPPGENHAVIAQRVRRQVLASVAGSQHRQAPEASRRVWQRLDRLSAEAGRLVPAGQVAAAVSSRKPLTATQRQVHPAARPHQLGGDLAT